MRLLIVGAGGHAKVVVDAAMAAGYQIAGIVGQPGDPAEILGHAIVHDASGIEADGFIVAIGDNATRARYFAEHLARGLTPAVILHPSVIVGSQVKLGGGTFAAAGVIVNAGANIAENCILNTGCTVDHDCAIGAHSHIGPQVALCGGVTLGDGVLIGVGSAAAPLARVGEWSVVGAGATVIGDLPGHAICVGTPARPQPSPESAQ
jgi:sugar O-acyltransferase (sialic acid O-acetyltransferase NeuD family)